MLNIALVCPEIHQNTGNIARTCAATGARLHLVRPLGFDISDKALKRAGLDYWYLLDVQLYENLPDFLVRNADRSMWFLSTKAPRSYTQAEFRDGDFLVFGPESKGLPETLLEERRERCLRIPMVEDARSLNLSNSAAMGIRRHDSRYRSSRSSGRPLDSGPKTRKSPS